MAVDNQNIKHKTKLAVYWSFFNNIANQGLSFVFGIIMARLLSPSDFGILAMPAVFIALSGAFINSGFNTALVRKTDLREEDLSTAFIFNTVVGFIFSCILFVCSPLIADFYNQQILADVLKVSSVTMFLGAFQSVHYVQFNRNLDFKTPAKISVISNLTTYTVGITLAYNGWGIWALVFQGIAGLLVSMCLVWSYSKWRPKTGWSCKSFRYLWGYGSKLLGSSIISIIYDNIYPIVIGKFYNASQLGLYNRAEGWARMPYKNICGVVEGVTFPVLSKVNSDKEKLRNAFKQMLKTISFVIFPVMMGLSAVAHPLVITILSSKWKECIPMLQIICFAVSFWPIHSLNFSLLKVIGKTDILLKLDMIGKSLGILIMCFTVPNGLIAMCFGGIIHSVLSLLITTYYSGKFLDMGLISQTKCFMKSLFLSLLIFFMIKTISNFIENDIYELLLEIPLAIIIYIAIAYILKFEELDNVIYMLKRNR